MTTYRLFDVPSQYVDENGHVRGYAKLKFTLGPDTDTPVTVYQDIAGASTHINPVTADSTGLIPAIYLDTSVASVRVRADVAGGDFSDPLWDIVYTQSSSSATAYNVGTGAGEIGLNSGDNIISGSRRVTGSTAQEGSSTHTGTDNFNGATVTLPITAAVGTGGPRVGYRDIPLGTAASPNTATNADYTLALADAGRGIFKSNGTAYSYTVPPNGVVAFPLGTIIQILNTGSAGAITVLRGSTVALRLAGVSTDDDWEIAAYGEATIQKVGTNSWIIRGTGVTT